MHAVHQDVSDALFHDNLDAPTDTSMLYGSIWPPLWGWLVVSYLLNFVFGALEGVDEGGGRPTEQKTCISCEQEGAAQRAAGTW